MSLNGWLQISVFIAAVLLLAKPMGSFMTCVFERRRTFLDPVLVPCERLLYRVTGVDPEEEIETAVKAVTEADHAVLCTGLNVSLFSAVGLPKYQLNVL